MEKPGTKKISTALSVLGLALLLLVSPCQVRNFIQAELGLPQTEVSNKSKTALTQSSCQTPEVSETDLIPTTRSTLSVSPIEPQSNYLGFKSLDLPAIFSPFTERNHPVAFVPFYILYRNFKVYL